VSESAQEQLPRRLWWILAGLTLGWGFNWTAMKVSLSEVSPWTFRTFCLAGGAAILLAALTWAIGTVLQKKFPVSVPVGVFTAWMMLIGGVPIVLVAAIADLGRHPPISLEAWLAIAYNVFVAFAWAHWAWIKIATSVSVTVFALSMLLIPVVGVISGMLFLGERPSWHEYGAMLLILGALGTVVIPQRR
jgi:drug/metabolite transporter (DMT)-like permease